MMWYYDVQWLTAPLCGRYDHFLDEASTMWTPYEANVISFMNANSIAVAMWAYFP